MPDYELIFRLYIDEEGNLYDENKILMSIVDIIRVLNLIYEKNKSTIYLVSLETELLVNIIEDIECIRYLTHKISTVNNFEDEFLY